MYNERLDNVVSDFQRIEAYDGKTYEDYFINTKGVIINCRRKTLRVMKPKVNNWGYYVISLRDSNNVRTEYSVHKLVAKTYIPNPRGNKNQVNHIDGDKLNNDIVNLEWCNQSENTQHAYDNGLIDGALKPFKLFYKGNVVGDFSKQKDMVVYLCLETKLSFDHVRKCVSGERPITKRSALYGYVFKQL